MADYGIKEKGFIYTGDCAMVTGPNLIFMGGTENPKVRFISRMPATFSVVNTLTGEAVAKDSWTPIGKLSEESKKESAFYRSYEKTVRVEDNTYRAVVIHSN